MALNLNTTNHLQRELSKEYLRYNKAMKELTTEKTSDRLYLLNASEALEASKKYAKSLKLNEKSLADTRAVISKMEDTLSVATNLEQAAADPEMSLDALNLQVATFVTDTLAVNPELNALTTVTLTTYDGATGSVIDSTGTAVVGSATMDAFGAAYGTSITDAASLTVTNLETDATTKVLHTGHLNTLIGLIKDGINKASVVETTLLRYIDMQEINKDLKTTRADIDHSVDITDLKRTISKASDITSNIRQELY